MNKYLNFVKSIYTINPEFTSIHNEINNTNDYFARCEYMGTNFEARIESKSEMIHFDTDYLAEDIAIALTIKLNNYIYDYIQNNNIEK